MRVRIVMEEVLGHRIDDGARYLRSTRPIEIRDWKSVVDPLQRGELRTCQPNRLVRVLSRSNGGEGAHEISTPAHCSTSRTASTWSATSPNSPRASVNRSAVNCVTGDGTL